MPTALPASVAEFLIVVEVIFGCEWEEAEELGGSCRLPGKGADDSPAAVVVVVVVVP